jgi:hypothetical protein
MNRVDRNGNGTLLRDLLATTRLMNRKENTNSGCCFNQRQTNQSARIAWLSEQKQSGAAHTSEKGALSEHNY